MHILKPLKKRCFCPLFSGRNNRGFYRNVGGYKVTLNLKKGNRNHTQGEQIPRSINKYVL